MEPLVIVEVLERSGRVSERHPCFTLPITIGRAYTNQVVLDDPYVSPRHLRVEHDPDGVLVATDLESTNGLYLLPSITTVVRTTLAPGQRIRIGRTTLRFQSPYSPVDEARLDRSTEGLWWTLASSRFGFVALFLTASALILAGKYLNSYQRVSFLRLVSDTLPVMIGLLGWSGGWALASRVATHHFRFPAHVSIAGAGVISAAVLGVAADYAAFAASSDTAVTILHALGGGLILAGTLYGHLRQCAHAGRMRLAVTAAGVSCLIVVTSVIAEVNHRADFSSDPQFPKHLVTPRIRVWRDVSSEEFFQQALSLKSQTDRLAQDRSDDPAGTAAAPP